MPRYTTVEKVYDAYPVIGSLSSISSAQVAQALDQEEALVEGMLSRRYTVPFTPTPPLVAAAVVDLTVMRMIQTRLRDRGAQDENLAKTLSRSWTLIQDVANGKVSLTSPDGEVLEGMGESGVTSTGSRCLIMGEGDWETMGWYCWPRTGCFP